MMKMLMLILTVSDNKDESLDNTNNTSQVQGIQHVQSDEDKDSLLSDTMCLVYLKQLLSSSQSFLGVHSS